MTLSGLDLLVVEDEALLARQIRSHLESLGADVSLAASLGEARTLLGRLDYDFALLDVNLPDGQGTELLRDGRFPPAQGSSS